MDAPQRFRHGSALVSPRTRFVFLATIVSAGVLLSGLAVSGLVAETHSELVRDVVEFRADRPVAFRVLVPMTAWLVALLLTPFESGLLSLAHGFGPTRFVIWRIEPAEPLLALSTALVMWGFFLGFILAMERLLILTTPVRRSWARIGALASLLFLLPYFNLLRVYDPATLCLTAVSYVLLAERRWRTYAAVFAISCLNRETTVVMMLIYFLYARGILERRAMAQWLFLQGLAFLVIRSALEVALWHNPGQRVWWWLLPIQLRFLWSYGTVPFAVAFSVLVPYALVVNRSRLLKIGLTTWPIHFALYMFAGMPGEFRVFYECAPVALALAAGALWQLDRIRRGLAVAAG